MKRNTVSEIGFEESYKTIGCLSCGTTENLGKRRYCSKICRQKLRYHLDIRTGLLKALNTQYATFYFNEGFINMDLRPYDTHEIFSFIYPRSPNTKPAAEFFKMAEKLSNVWWAEKRRTQKRYLATRHVFEHAYRNRISSESIRPMEINNPSLIGNSLIYLKLNKSSLNSPELPKIIKSAYWRQAKEHHPDQGGDAAFFRKIHKAYQEMNNWAKNPTFVVRRGFPDKWFYDGNKNKWIQPLPC
ncbi:MAG: J domain-containing protein [Desulfobacterales bacterium]|nr:J domain-containing protein [Desulfobacterales bacterium]